MGQGQPKRKPWRALFTSAYGELKEAVVPYGLKLIEGRDVSWAVQWLPVGLALGRLSAQVSELVRQRAALLASGQLDLSLTPEQLDALKLQVEALREATPHGERWLELMGQLDSLYGAWLKDERATETIWAILGQVELKADALLAALFERATGAPSQDEARQTLQWLEQLETIFDMILSQLILPKLLARGPLSRMAPAPPADQGQDGDVAQGDAPCARAEEE